MPPEFTLPEDATGTPEHVAFEMAKFLVTSERSEAETETEFLQLYSRCLKAAQGQRVTGG